MGNVQGGYQGVAGRERPSPKAHCCEFVEDLVYGVSEEKRRLRTFYRKNLPMLRDGACFRLVFSGTTKHDTTAQNVWTIASSVFSMFGGGRGGPGGVTSGAVNYGATKAGEPIWLSLVEDDTQLEWKTLANEHNKPKAQRRHPLHNISRAVPTYAGDKSSTDGETMRLSFEDKNGDCILCVEADSSVERDLWQAAVENALQVLKPNLDSNRRTADRSLMLEQRRLDIADRDRAREERKKKLTGGKPLGMKYTAQAMARV